MSFKPSVAAWACAAAFAASTTPTLDDSLNLKTVSGAQISPDGRFVAYSVSEANWEENDFVSQIWIAIPPTGERYQLTRGKKSSSGPVWSPDSRRLTFTSDRDGKRQIYLISPSGGEAQQLTNEENGVGAIAWSPDSSSIAFTSSGPDKAKKDRKDKYGDFEIYEGDYSMNHLWLVRIPAEIPGDVKKLPKPEQLTKGEQFSVGLFSWSPDGKHIAFDAQRDPDLGSSATQTIYVLDLADLHVRKLLESGGPNGNPKWSPDGKQIAYMTSNGQQFYYWANRYIAVVAADGGQPSVVSKDFDENANLIGWGPDGIYFSAVQKTAAHIFRIDPATRALRRITEPDPFVAHDASFTKDYRSMAGSGAAPNRFGDIYTTAVSDFAPKYLTDTGAEWKDYKLASREVVQWKSSDGAAIEGILIKPADYDVSKKYPLLVVIHGGPTGVDTPALSADQYYPIERFAAKGALILKVNYRGSAGYGEKFRALNVRNLGVGDYEDVISGVDSLIARGIVDKDRVGAMGWSQGGYISAFITCYSDRFKAVSVGAGISDWMTYYVNTDVHPFTRQYLKGTPWDDPEIYRKTSPITYVSRARTPTLIQHGDQDKRVPPPNAFGALPGIEGPQGPREAGSI